MSDTASARAAFSLEGFEPSRFAVVEYNGRDAVSEPYRFSITLTTHELVPEGTPVVTRRASLEFGPASRRTVYNGLTRSFSLVGNPRPGLFVYRAELVPAFDFLRQTRNNQVFLDKTLPEIIRSILKQQQIHQYELRVSGEYPVMEYVCQYNESHFDFLCRWMQRRGMYYYFEQRYGNDVVVITDDRSFHQPCCDQPLRYQPPSGLEDIHDRGSTVSAFIAQHNAVPEQVLLRDYNYRTPHVQLEAPAPVSENGAGTHYIYGDSFQTQDEGTALARIRAQAFSCREVDFRGEGFASCLRAGMTFSLRGHFQPERDTEYFVTTVNHFGARPDADALLGENAAVIGKSVYRNTFSAIAGNVQYRDHCTTAKPAFRGVLTAFVDAASSGQYAELDELGRYKVRLPFEEADKPGGRASCWIRLAQPYAGVNYGMHFPLLKGTEVLLDFVDDDIDRPVILSAVPNTELGNVVKDTNQPVGAIKTAGGNILSMSDLKGKQYVGLSSPQSGSTIFLGETPAGPGVGIGSDGFLDLNSYTQTDSSILRTTWTVAKTSTLGFDTAYNLYKSTYNLASTIDWSWGSKLEMQRDGLCVLTKEYNSLADKQVIAGGQSAMVKTLQTTTHNWLKIVAAISLFGFGTSMASKMVTWLDKPEPTLDTVAEYSGYATGIADLLVSTIAVGGALSKLTKAVPALQVVATSRFELDDDGIMGKVNIANNPGAELKLAVGPVVVDTVTFTMDSTSATTKVKPSMGTIALSNTEAKLGYPTSQITVTPADMKYELSGTAIISAGATTTEMTNVPGTGSVKITPMSTTVQNNVSTTISSNGRLILAGDGSVDIQADIGLITIG
ncbi:type VI secretion system Vgr family protein [Desulfovibrio inopinatus]|uniref:type VI secretion system Vgr family protein n=1 Tax=Desulfovibrio inopinatus TaxID=102109 RepID=UPI00040E5622|nr:type VI secretion system tip protein TssI/VgrG [Desulfovibrio inopinatus]